MTRYTGVSGHLAPQGPPNQLASHYASRAFEFLAGKAAGRAARLKAEEEAQVGQETPPKAPKPPKRSEQRAEELHAARVAKLRADTERKQQIIAKNAPKSKSAAPATKPKTQTPPKSTKQPAPPKTAPAAPSSDLRRCKGACGETKDIKHFPVYDKGKHKGKTSWTCDSCTKKAAATKKFLSALNDNDTP